MLARNNKVNTDYIVRTRELTPPMWESENSVSLCAPGSGGRMALMFPPIAVSAIGGISRGFLLARPKFLNW